MKTGRLFVSAITGSAVLIGLLAQPGDLQAQLMQSQSLHARSAIGGFVGSTDLNSTRVRSVNRTSTYASLRALDARHRSRLYSIGGYRARIGYQSGYQYPVSGFTSYRYLQPTYSTSFFHRPYYAHYRPNYSYGHHTTLTSRSPYVFGPNLYSPYRYYSTSSYYYRPLYSFPRVYSTYSPSPSIVYSSSPYVAHVPVYSRTVFYPRVHYPVIAYRPYNVQLNTIGGMQCYQPYYTYSYPACPSPCLAVCPSCIVPAPQTAPENPQPTPANPTPPAAPQPNSSTESAPPDSTAPAELPDRDSVELDAQAAPTADADQSAPESTVASEAEKTVTPVQEGPALQAPVAN